MRSALGDIKDTDQDVDMDDHLPSAVEIDIISKYTLGYVELLDQFSAATQFNTEDEILISQWQTTMIRGMI